MCESVFKKERSHLLTGVNADFISEVPFYGSLGYVGSGRPGRGRRGRSAGTTGVSVNP